MPGRHGSDDDATTQQAYYGGQQQGGPPPQAGQGGSGHPPPGPGPHGPQQVPPQYQFQGGYRPPQPPRPPVKRKKWPWIVGAVVLLFLIIGIANGGSDQSAAPVAGQPQPSSAAPAAAGSAPSAASSPSADAPSSDAPSGKVVLEVTGQGRAGNITYSSNGSGGQSQKTNARLPFRQEIPAEALFGVYSIVAQNGQNSGSIKCKITKDGEVIGEGESEGPFSVVTCTGS